MSEAKKNGWGGARPGAGRKRAYLRIDVKVPAEIATALQELRRAVEGQQERIAELQRRDRELLLLRRLIEIERHLGMRERPTPPRHSRRRPLG